MRGYLERTGLAAVLISRQDNFAWLTAGRDNHVVASAEAGVAHLLVTRDGRFALADRIEVGRMRDEEIGNQGWEWRTYDWYEPHSRDGAVRELIGDGSLAADTPVPGARPLDRGFDDLRSELFESEVERYRIVGRIATEAVVQTCQHLHVGQTEHEIAAEIDRRVRAQGARAGVVLIAVDDRISQYRHPIPTERKLRDYGMLVLGASKWGLQVSITRFVAFHPVSGELRAKWRDVSQIAAYFTIATRPGQPWSGLFRGATDLYRDLGWPDEWKLHHQGGPTGYRGREFTATFNSEGTVSARQAAAWNPSITGTKSEDTILVDESGHEFLTRHNEWPMLAVEHRSQRLEFPDVLVRQQVVRRYA